MERVSRWASRPAWAVQGRVEPAAAGRDDYPVTVPDGEPVEVLAARVAGPRVGCRAASVAMGAVAAEVAGRRALLLVSAERVAAPADWVGEPQACFQALERVAELVGLGAARRVGCQAEALDEAAAAVRVVPAARGERARAGAQGSEQAALCLGGCRSPERVASGERRVLPGWPRAVRAEPVPGRWELELWLREAQPLPCVRAKALLPGPP